MARDYAARNRKPAARPAGLPGWVWLVAGLSMGLVVAVVVYIGRPAAPMPMAPAAGAAAQMAAAKPKTKIEIPPAVEPRFDFYRALLENEQVVVADKNGSSASKIGALPAAPMGAAPTPPAATPSQKPAQAATSLADAAPVASVKPAAGAGSEKFLVLTGAFRDRTNAEEHRASLALAGVEAGIEAVKAADGATLHRVRVGPLANKDRALNVLAQLRADGFDGQVVRQQ